ncbi:zinc ribbon domain-containing protein [Gordonia rubripertincta]|uniref:zinc ribbon domain-containing protein n=1 Tax=Gordonia rubripertincta TaxID=36822 RepID=UPI000E5ADDFE|nr:hydroxymethylglutaryl-CoA synthase family protein [Gordonia rubripertincta]
MSNAILGYATYVPSWRVDPAGRGRAARVVASFDEDAVTMAVAAGQRVIAGHPSRVPSTVLATSTPPYLDKSNATIVHAALGLDRTGAAFDAIGTARTTMGVLRSMLRSGGLLTAADVRTGQPGSADERGGADAAAAVLVGRASEHAPALAEVLAEASVTEEVLDRWRPPTATWGSTWEERFGFEHYARMIREIAARVLDDAGLAQADHVVVVSGNSAVAKRAATLVKGALSTGGSPIGFAGAADPLVALGAVLDVAGPDETILLLAAADGVDALVLRATGALPSARQVTPIAEQLADSQTVPYPRYLSWRGLLEFEPPRRPEPDRAAGPPSARSRDWKFALTGSRCDKCAFLHLPPVSVCRQCGTVGESSPVAVAGMHGRIATYTVDHLAFSPSPPVVDAVVDFDAVMNPDMVMNPDTAVDSGTGTADGFGGGGRTTFEIADAQPDLLAVGAPVDLTFRRLNSAGGVHNYFWKARQVRTNQIREERGDED